MKKKLLFVAFSLIWYSNFAAKLNPQEVKALNQIWGKLILGEKKEWDFDTDSCRESSPSLTCNCYFESNSTCHVTEIDLSSETLPTALPSEFTKLPYLRSITLNSNHLKGTIPFKWATMRLNNLSLVGNLLSGPFPVALTRMTTLQKLNIEGNRFSGPIPQEIGNMKNLESLVLVSNDFTGELPATLAKLNNLIYLRISDNNFTGKLPDFISKWTKLEILHIQGCSFKGPIPSGISVLTQLTDLRISDLAGGASIFPPLANMTQLHHLVLRNCWIHGPIHDYLGNMVWLRTLDLSFNNLTGEIPSSFSNLTQAEYIYLKDNSLTGPMPRWIKSSTKNVDVSNNHFTWDAFGPKKCERTINMVESYPSSTTKENHINPCLRKGFPCTKPIKEQINFLYINCGGEEVNISNNLFQADREREGALIYFKEENRAFSSAGNFLDDEHKSDVYILSNNTILHNISTVDTELYTKARSTAVSLTYYGLCLMNGNYSVRLHFAEIFYEEDELFNCIGKRVFDVYVQGKLKLKDFDIVKEAGGVGRAVIKKYIVNVKNNTLMIHLYWAGKGRTTFPSTGSYGPIISAISVDSNFKPPVFKPPVFEKKAPTGKIVGFTVAGVFIIVFAVIVICLCKNSYIMGRSTTNRDLEVNTSLHLFSAKQIKVVTKNFDPSNKLGEGGFGAVYKGVLKDGRIVAVKQLSSKSKQGINEFAAEIGIVSALRHPNIVELYGYCIEKNAYCVIYAYMENNCLSHALFGTNAPLKNRLTWTIRLQICIGIARGLVCLHEESNTTIIHRDIKASNVLLDENLNAKISDFGLAKLYDDGDTHVTTSRAGTMGYMAPEYAMRGCMTPKVDVYSFGILALEIFSGKPNNHIFDNDDCRYLFDQAYYLQANGRLLELVDPDLGSLYPPKEALRILDVVFLCIDASPKRRPCMSETLKLLEGQTNIQDYLKELRFPITSQELKNLKKALWPNLSETLPMEEACTQSLPSSSSSSSSG